MTTPRILFFGRLNEIAAGRAFAPPADVRTLGALRAWLAAQDETLAAELARSGVRIALNRTLAPADAFFALEDEIAFMSPLSGG